MEVNSGPADGAVCQQQINQLVSFCELIVTLQFMSFLLTTLVCVVISFPLNLL